MPAPTGFDPPRLQDDSPEGCPSPMSEIMDYLRLESGDLDDVRESQLTFLRTAHIDGSDFWAWSIVESDGDEGYVYVEITRNGRMCTGYDLNWENQTVEQFLYDMRYE